MFFSKKSEKSEKPKKTKKAENKGASKRELELIKQFDDGMILQVDNKKDNKKYLKSLAKKR